MAGARDSCWWACAVLVALAAASLCFGQVNAGAADLKPNFYSGTCPTLEDICMETMQDWLDDDVGNAAGMIRLWFHDCIVSGCDGSVLLDHIPGKPRTEKEAGANGSLRGFDIIDDAKSRILDACPDALVSCTDITLLLTRNAVFLTGGPFWEVTLGRRDGTKSLASQTSALPSPFDTLSGITAKFTIWNLTETDMVVLSGAHTLGFSHCSSFESRLYSRNGSAIADPTMNKSLDKNLRKRCPQVNFNRVRRGAGSLLDLSSPEQFDNRYYSDLQQRFGVLASDQLLFESNRTRKLVNQLAANQRLFFNNFVTSMIRLSQLGVLTGAQGEVRLDCSVVNGPRTPPPAPPPAPAALPAPPPAVIPAPPPAVVLAPPPAVNSLPPPPPPPVVLAPPPAVNSLPPPPPPPPPPAATSLAPPPDTPAAAAPLAPPPDPPAADAAPPAPAFAAAAAPVSPPPDAPVLPA